ncbi:hypothetical protein [Luteimonas kalidii]|uniref:Uncharacterized protein n=1 Tax=Luteimonas kalidii TaxID=3042025 RepID=A0ABT6JWY0_9GAMM|nr:hypothetical protein [Luteimonas kalidii]MDH5835196.1 hypothetical protein [Luteimonas kalidii]
MQVGQDNAWRSVEAGRVQPRAMLLAASGLALVLGLWLLRDDHRAAVLDTLPAPLGHQAVSVPVQASRIPADAGDAGVRAVHDGARDDATGRRHRNPSRRSALETSDDLFAYSQQLLPALREGDPEAAWLMSRVVDTCAGYASDPAAFVRDSATLAALGFAAGPAMTAARERVATRCRRFTPTDGLSPTRVRQLRVQAAQGGNLPAEAELLARGEPVSTADDYAGALLDRVGSAGDADAFGALATAVEVPDWLSLLDREVAPQYHAITWQLAACRMGADCGPDSALMTSYCVNGGVCSRDPAQGFEAFVYDAAIPRQSVDHVSAAVDALVERFGGAP